MHCDRFPSELATALVFFSLLTVHWIRSVGAFGMIRGSLPKLGIMTMARMLVGGLVKPFPKTSKEFLGIKRGGILVEATLIMKMNGVTAVMVVVLNTGSLVLGTTVPTTAPLSTLTTQIAWLRIRVGCWLR